MAAVTTGGTAMDATKHWERVYATKRPDPLPSVFGFHEIWHLFVLAGSALHYAAILVLSS